MYTVISNSLYGSDIKKAQDKVLKHKMTHVIGLTMYPLNISNVETYNVSLNGNPNDNIHQHFNLICSMIHTVILAKGKLLIYCDNGTNLGASFAVAYLMQYQNKNYVEAMQILKNVNPAVNICNSYCKQLMMFEYELNKMIIM